MKFPPIDMKKFYLIGKWCFFISAIMMLAGWIDGLKVNTGLIIVKNLAGVVFNFALFGFFSWMHNQQTTTPDLNDDEMKALAGVVDYPNLVNKPKKKKEVKK